VNPTQLRLIGYRRVSTAGQVDRYGLPAQLTDLRGYAAREGCILVRVETDAAKSGTLPADQRPALVAALKSIAAGEADGLLVPGDLDRLARELTTQEAILGQVWKSGVVHTTMRGEIMKDDPDDPMRTTIRQVMGAFAQLDRALIAKRMRNGKRAKHEQGGYAGYGSPAFGQCAVGHELVANEAEQAVIARMRELRAEGKSYQAVADALNAEGLTSKRGGTWHSQTVRRVVKAAS
jgi:DNA invertase Pin-like site-specific DNA recombinase